MAWRLAVVGITFLLLAKQLALNFKKKRAESDEDEDVVDYNFLTVAAKEADMAMRKEEGGPFGAVIVRDGEIVAQAHNEVLKQKDPTAHAEIVAIQKVDVCFNVLGWFYVSFFVTLVKALSDKQNIVFLDALFNFCVMNV